MTHNLIDSYLHKFLKKQLHVAPSALYGKSDRGK